MIKLSSHELPEISPLFRGIDDSMLISCLQGSLGNAYIRAKKTPAAAVIISGDYSFWGGDPLSEDAAYLTEHFLTQQKQTAVQQSSPMTDPNGSIRLQPVSETTPKQCQDTVS